MKLISINVGRPREVVSHGEPVVTGIFKQPVDGVVAVRRLNVAGDEQADLSVHGGPDKAVYAYPLEHYDFWRNELGLEELPFGAFGENLTTEGLIEAEVNIGDQLRIGTAEFVVTSRVKPGRRGCSRPSRRRTNSTKGTTATATTTKTNVRR